jgi:hypothetical protein
MMMMMTIFVKKYCGKTLCGRPRKRYSNIKLDLMKQDKMARTFGQNGGKLTLQKK